MSAPEERETLTPRTSLYDQALRLLHAAPDGRPPGRGFALPDAARPERTPKSDAPENGTPGTPGRSSAASSAGGSAESSADGFAENSVAGFAASKETARRLLAPLLTDPDAERAAERVHRALREQGTGERPVRAAVAHLPLEDRTAALALARRLVRHGTSVAAVSVGIGLLARLGAPEDVPYLRVLGLLRDFLSQVVQALDGLDRPAAARLWLGGRVRKGELRALVDALTGQDEPAARRRLLEVPVTPRDMGPTQARRVAEAMLLADLVRTDPVDPRLLERAGHLLVMMASTYDSQVELLAYEDAVAVYEAVIAGAARLTPDPGRGVLLLSLALELRSGPSLLLPWPPGRREALLETLRSRLSAPEWAAVGAHLPSGRQEADEYRRVRWYRQTLPRLLAGPAPYGRLRVEPTLRDPAYRQSPETRLLLDGLPLVPAHFGKGPAGTPAHLLDRGALRATAEPHEVRLAEAWCTEGCCGALYVTIRRDGDEVVWSDWRQSLGNPPRLGTERFDAAAYDAEIERAAADRAWEWPAAATARLVEEGLRERPALLTRWDLRQDWTGTDHHDPEATTLAFTYWPGLAEGRRDRTGPWLQFVWHLPDDGAPPEDRAAAALHRLATEDPKEYAQVRGGSAEHARALGYPWP